MATVIQLL